jgi:hypothetical protein
MIQEKTCRKSKYTEEQIIHALREVGKTIIRR